MNSRTRPRRIEIGHELCGMQVMTCIAALLCMCLQWHWSSEACAKEVPRSDESNAMVVQARYWEFKKLYRDALGEFGDEARFAAWRQLLSCDSYCAFEDPGDSANQYRLLVLCELSNEFHSRLSILSEGQKPAFDNWYLRMCYIAQFGSYRPSPNLSKSEQMEAAAEALRTALQRDSPSLEALPFTVEALPYLPLVCACAYGESRDRAKAEYNAILKSLIGIVDTSTYDREANALGLAIQ
jgi:hypothetical protein